MDVFEWLKSCAVGTTLGLFPLWWWLSSIAFELKINNEKLPKLLMEVAKNSPGPGLFAQLPIKHSHVTTYRVLTIIYLVAFFSFTQYFAIKYYLEGDTKYFLNLETGFTPFLLLTVALPSFLIKRYLRKINNANKST